MTAATVHQPALFEAPKPLEARILEAAREQSIMRVVYYPDSPHFNDGLRWASFCEFKGGGGGSGPVLDDFEAAVLIAHGWPWSVFSGSSVRETAVVMGDRVTAFPEPKPRKRDAL